MFIRNVRRFGVSTALLAAAIPGFGQIYPGQYAVILKDAPVVARFASREAMRGPDAGTYRRQVVAVQDAVHQQMDRRNIQVIASVDTVLNAVFVATTPDRLDEIRQIPGVLEVVPLRRIKPMLNRATQLVNAPAAWTALGGQGSAGQGIKVAVLDFGIDQTHPAFQDPSLPMPTGFPKCTDGHPEDCAYTNNKVIVARSYVRMIAPGSNPSTPAADSRPDDYSPRDHEGHGTAIASVIAGNNATGTVTITGMAPKAYLGSYKIFGSPFVN
jgi:subtilisin family serine protease